MIFVNYQPFLLNTEISILKDEPMGEDPLFFTQSTAEDIAQYVVNLAYKYDEDTVKITAAEDFVSELESQIQELEMSKYSTNKIKVENML